MSAFIQELSTNFFETISKSLDDLTKEKHRILKIHSDLDRELQDIKRRIEKAKENILDLQNLSINAMRRTGRFETVMEESRREVLSCGCYLGYYCDRGGCSGPGGTYIENRLVKYPILEPNYEARQQASEQLAPARNELNRLLIESKPRCSKLEAAIKEIGEEERELRRIENIFKECNKTLTLINRRGRTVEISRSHLIDFYSMLENKSRLELIHLLVALDQSGKVLKNFALQLHKINPDLAEDLACHLYGMAEIGDIATQSEKNQFKLEVFNSNLYKNNERFDRINLNLVKQVMIDTIKLQIQRLNSSDEWWMISSKSTTQSLNRLIDLIQDPNYRHLTYNELIDQWSKESTLTNFLEEKTTRGALINNHRNIFSLFSCSDTKTYSFIQGLKNKFGDKLINPDPKAVSSKPIALVV